MSSLSFLSRAPTHRSFTFNLWFFYELKHKPHHECGIFNFWFCLIILKFMYLFNKMHGLFGFKTSRKATHDFAPRRLIFKLHQEVLKSNNTAWVGAPQNWPGEKFFKPRKSKFWKRLNSNFKVIIWHYFT